MKIVKKIVNILRPRSKKEPIYIPTLYGELLQGRTALITGGTSGIGFAIAKAFLHSGARVIITGRDIARVDIACKKLEQLDEKFCNKVLGVQLNNLDIANLSDNFYKMLQTIPNEHIDILINNAGVNKGGSFSTVTEEEYDEILDVNLKGTYFISQLTAKYMIEHKIQGNILNVSSVSSLRPAIFPYAISKWGIRGFTLGLAKTLIKHGIVVNGLAPGPTATPMLVNSEYSGIELATNPSGRYATAEEIANMAVILSSNMGRMIVGDTVFITGGAGNLVIDDVPYNI